MIQSLQQHRSARPRIPISAPRVLKKIWSMTTNFGRTDSATQLQVTPDAPDSDTKPDDAVSLHSLLEVVGQCALASQKIESNTNIPIRREILEGLIQDAEREMLPAENAILLSGIRVGVQTALVGGSQRTIGY